MNLELTREQSWELHLLLAGALRELSHEIAATDNARYRSDLAARRQLLSDISDGLDQVAPRASEADAVERELAHPGG